MGMRNPPQSVLDAVARQDAKDAAKRATPGATPTPGTNAAQGGTAASGGLSVAQHMDAAQQVRDKRRKVTK